MKLNLSCLSSSNFYKALRSKFGMKYKTFKLFPKYPDSPSYGWWLVSNQKLNHLSQKQNKLYNNWKQEMARGHYKSQLMELLSEEWWDRLCSLYFPKMS